MIAQYTGSNHVIWRHFGRTVSIVALAVALSHVGDARAQEAPKFNITLYPETTTVLYFNAGNKLLWVEKLDGIEERVITPIEDKNAMSLIPFPNRKYPDGTPVKAEKHFDCSTCPEKKADLVTGGVAAKAVYCARRGSRTGIGHVAPLVVEDLTNIQPRLIKLASTSDPEPCPFPKKCHCSQGACCCW